MKLVEPVHLLPKQNAFARVELEDSCSLSGPVLLEASDGLTRTIVSS